jgi:anthraniloyl-CoA monooxygenase
MDSYAQLPVDCADPWGPDAAAVVDRVRDLQGSGRNVVELTGKATRSGLLDRLALGERIRTEVGVRVHVAALAEHLDDVAGGLVAGRADLTSVAAS